MTQPLDQLALQYGSGFQPTTPLGAASIGGTPKQQDMAGTEAAKQAAIAKATQETRQQDTQLRQEATPEELAAIQKSKQLQALGSIGARVQQAAVKGLQAQKDQLALQPVMKVNKDAISDRLGLSYSEKLLQDADPTSTLNQAHSAIGMLNSAGDDTTREAAIAKLMELGVPIDNLGGYMQAEAPVVNEKDLFSINNLDLTDLGEGISSLDDVANILGVPTQELSKFSITELDDMVEAERQKTFSQISALDAQIASLPVGSSQRAALERKRSDLASVGVFASEEALIPLKSALEAGQKIKVAGQDVPLQDILDNQTINKEIKNWLQASPEEREQIFSSTDYPEFVQFLKQNENALAVLNQKIQTSELSYKQLQKDYKEIGGFKDALGESDADKLLRILDPTYGTKSGITSADLKQTKDIVKNNKLLSGLNIKEEAPEIQRLVKASPVQLQQIVKTWQPWDLRISADLGDIRRLDDRWDGVLNYIPGTDLVDPKDQDKYGNYISAIRYAEGIAPEVLDGMKFKDYSPGLIMAKANEVIAKAAYARQKATDDARIAEETRRRTEEETARRVKEETDRQADSIFTTALTQFNEATTDYTGGFAKDISETSFWDNKAALEGQIQSAETMLGRLRSSKDPTDKETLDRLNRNGVIRNLENKIASIRGRIKNTQDVINALPAISDRTNFLSLISTAINTGAKSFADQIRTNPAYKDLVTVDNIMGVRNNFNITSKGMEELRKLKGQLNTVRNNQVVMRDPNVVKMIEKADGMFKVLGV